MGERLIGQFEVQARLGGIAPSTLSRLKKQDPHFPKPVFDFGQPKYREADLDAYIRQLSRLAGNGLVESEASESPETIASTRSPRSSSA